MFNNVQIYHKNIFETTMYPYKFGKKLPPHNLRSSYATGIERRGIRGRGDKGVGVNALKKGFSSKKFFMYLNSGILF